MKTNSQELDFIINEGDFKAVVDAKYKPRYKSGNPSMEDARQVSGYARLNKVYKVLGMNENELIPIYLIYPEALQNTDLLNNTIEIESFETLDNSIINIIENKSLFGKENDIHKSTSYKALYMQAIDLD